jgi:hypothetical protein
MLSKDSNREAIKQNIFFFPLILFLFRGPPFEIQIVVETKLKTY